MTGSLRSHVTRVDRLGKAGARSIFPWAYDGLSDGKADLRSKPTKAERGPPYAENKPHKRRGVSGRASGRSLQVWLIGMAYR
jgi:hypothetical protein